MYGSNYHSCPDYWDFFKGDGLRWRRLEEFLGKLGLWMTQNWVMAMGFRDFWWGRHCRIWVFDNHPNKIGDQFNKTLYIGKLLLGNIVLLCYNFYFLVVFKKFNKTQRVITNFVIYSKKGTYYIFNLVNFFVQILVTFIDCNISHTKLSSRMPKLIFSFNIDFPSNLQRLFRNSITKY